jgi:hypothetical protein
MQLGMQLVNNFNDGLSFFLTILFFFRILILGRSYVRFGRFFDKSSLLQIASSVEPLVR